MEKCLMESVHALGKHFTSIRIMMCCRIIDRAEIRLFLLLAAFLFFGVIFSAANAAEKIEQPAHAPHASKVKQGLFEARNNLLTDNKKQDTIYACPMHPKVTSSEPGKCSICGMFLVAESQDDDGTHDHAMSHDVPSVQQDSEPELFWENKESQSLTQQQHKQHYANRANRP